MYLSDGDSKIYGKRATGNCSGKEQYNLKIADRRKFNEKSRSISSPVKSGLPGLFKEKKRFKTPKKHPKSRSISRAFH